MVLIETHNRPRRRFVWPVLMLCCLLVVSMTPTATDAKLPVQPQDPLHEKLDSLKAKLEHYLTHSFGREDDPAAASATFEAISFETCKISWKVFRDFGHSTEMPVPLRDVKTVTYVSVNLSSIDPARTRIYSMETLKRYNVPWSLALDLKIRPGRPRFTQQTIVTKGGKVTRISVEARSYTFLFNHQDQQIAEDISKAFADASNICRSRTLRRR